MKNNKKYTSMAKYEIKIIIDANDVKQAQAIADALQDTSDKVTGDELCGMMKILEKNPTYIKMAKLASKFA